MFVGIDLGGAKGRTTGVAVLENWKGRARVRDLEIPVGDDELMEVLLRYHGKAKVIAIDAPLTLPACMRCVRKECPSPELCGEDSVKGQESPYTQRHTELWIKRELGIRPMPTMVLGMITSRGIHIARRLRATMSCDVIEVYPKATLFSLARVKGIAGQKYDDAIRKYKSKNADPRQIRYLTVSLSPLLDFGKFLEDCWHDHNGFDAAIAGLTAYLYHKGKAIQAVEKGMEYDGAIWVPDWKRIKL